MTKAQGFGCNDVLLGEVSVTQGTEELTGIGEANQVHESGLSDILPTRVPVLNK